MKPIISLYQRDIRQPLPGPGDDEYEFIIKGIKDSETFIFPEYFCFHKKLREQADFVAASEAALKWLQQLSQTKEAANTMIVGGSLLRTQNGRAFNATPLLFQGDVLDYYHKRRLFGHEETEVSAGSKPVTVEHPETRKQWGFLICADVFLPRAFKSYKGVDYIAAPTSSPYRGNDSPEDQLKRDRKLYQKGARKSKSVVLKCCSVGEVGENTPERPAPRLQGRSSIATPKDILVKAPDIYWTGLLRYRVDDGTTMTEHLATIEPHENEYRRIG